jgi:hypothetical protein
VYVDCPRLFLRKYKYLDWLGIPSSVNKLIFNKEGSTETMYQVKACTVRADFTDIWKLGGKKGK